MKSRTKQTHIYNYTCQQMYTWNPSPVSRFLGNVQTKHIWTDIPFDVLVRWPVPGIVNPSVGGLRTLYRYV